MYKNSKLPQTEVCWHDDLAFTLRLTLEKHSFLKWLYMYFKYFILMKGLCKAVLQSKKNPIEWSQKAPNNNIKRRSGYPPATVSVTRVYLAANPSLL